MRAYMIVFLTLNIIGKCIGSHSESTFVTAPTASEIHEPRNYFRWTPEFESALLKIYLETDTGQRGHAARIYRKWSEMYPGMSYMDRNHLYNQAKFLVGRLLRNESTRKMMWTEPLREELLSLYDSKNTFSEVFDEWTKRHPGYNRSDREKLRSMIRYLDKRRRMKMGLEPAPLKRDNFNWTRQLNTDLMFIHHDIHKRKRRITTELQQLWLKMHPEFTKMTGAHLANQAYSLSRRNFQPTSDEWKDTNKRYEKLLASESNEHRRNEEINPHQEGPSNKNAIQTKHRMFQYHPDDEVYIPSPPGNFSDISHMRSAPHWLHNNAHNFGDFHSEDFGGGSN